MTVRDKALHEDKATEWPVFQKFRRLAEDAMLRSGLDTADARMQLNEMFRDGIVNAYVERVPVLGASEGQSQAELARKIGSDPSTYSRSRKRGSLPKCDKFFVLAAATDAKLPRGADAALRGFCEAFDEVQVRLRQPSTQLSVSQALCLWAVFRTQEWWEALCSKNAQTFRVATANVHSRMMDYQDDYLDDTECMSVPEIQSVIDQRLIGWTALELIITHEWL